MNLIYLIFVRTFIYFLALFVQVVNIFSYYAAFTLNAIADAVNSNMSLVGHTLLLFRIKILNPVPYI